MEQNANYYSTQKFSSGGNHNVSAIWGYGSFLKSFTCEIIKYEIQNMSVLR